MSGASRRFQRGLSLVEMLVACSLLLLALTLGFGLLEPSLRHSRSGLEQVDRLQTASRIRRNLQKDFATTVPSGVSYHTGSTSMLLAVHPLGTVTANGQQAWAPEVMVYAWDEQDKTLRKTHWKQADSTLAVGTLTMRPREFTQSEMQAMSGEGGHFTQVLALDLKSLELEWHQSVEKALPLKVSYTLEAQTKEKNFSFETYFPQSL